MNDIKPKIGNLVSTKEGCVFLVDDNPVYLSVLEQEVKSIFPFAKINSFTSGEAALHHINPLHPFLVFLDYDLAEKLNGVAVLKKMKKESPTTEIVMISGINDKSVIEKSMRNGAFDYIIKGENALFALRENVSNILKKMYHKTTSDRREIDLSDKKKDEKLMATRTEIQVSKDVGFYRENRLVLLMGTLAIILFVTSVYILVNYFMSSPD